MLYQGCIALYFLCILDMIIAKYQGLSIAPWESKLLAMDSQFDFRDDMVVSVILQLNLVRGPRYAEAPFILVFPLPIVS